ncbi:MAG: hypothetical protein JSU92_06370 [Deltaproteobacteria bacterium]|nr:MAG: hypothetical protein JSU92_06370 [Deltaproteobacteria bacterium]
MEVKEAKSDVEWTVEKLKALKVPEIMELFLTLTAPLFKEMNGEFEGSLLDHGNALSNFFSRTFTSSLLINGRWLCKGFTPVSETEGHGYNSFMKFGKVIRKYRMKTCMAASRFDGKEVFQLYYPAYKNLIGKINSVDEIRKVRDGLYLAVGTIGFTEKQRMRPYPFVLSGPVGEFVGSDSEELL